MSSTFSTTGAALRAVTGWTEIDFVDDDAEVVVHFGHSGRPYVLWTDEQGAARELGTLTADELVCLGSRLQDDPGFAGVTLSNALRWARTATAGDYLIRYSDTGLTDAQDLGSRCGFNDDEIDSIERALRARDMTLEADDVGLRAAAEVSS